MTTRALYESPYIHIEENGNVITHRLDSRKKQDELFERYKLLVESAVANGGQIVSDKTMLPEVTLH